MRARDIIKLTTFHDELNPELWQENNLKREVEYKLLQIAKEFIEFIDIPDLKLEDITISGSNCSYNYNDQSDIDLHLIVDSDQPCWEPLNALFMAKKSLFNDQHDIKIRGNAVEVYVQDAKQPHISNGIYSVIRDKWIKQPKKITDTPDKTNALHKYQFLKHEIEQAIASDDPTAIVKTQARIKDMRKAGLAKNGEFGAENLAFKMLRNDGSLEDLYNAATVAQDKRLSLPENDNLIEAVSGKDMLRIFRKQHWDDPGSNPEMDQYILSHDWGIRMIQPSEIPDEEELFDIDDPFGRIIEIDPAAVRYHAKDIARGSTAPIIMGPGKNIIDGNHRAQAAKAMNKPIQAYVPMEKVDENFADGKIKGKSRPGRVKKAGASCKGSVTSLRQKAKKYGGERGKMYHWCANMKSGRNKG